jgi:hypothetical protein
MQYDYLAFDNGLYLADHLSERLPLDTGMIFDPFLIVRLEALYFNLARVLQRLMLGLQLFLHPQHLSFLLRVRLELTRLLGGCLMLRQLLRVELGQALRWLTVLLADFLLAFGLAHLFHFDDAVYAVLVILEIELCDVHIVFALAEVNHGFVRIAQPHHSLVEVITPSLGFPLLLRAGTTYLLASVVAYDGCGRAGLGGFLLYLLFTFVLATAVGRVRRLVILFSQRIIDLGRALFFLARLLIELAAMMKLMKFILDLLRHSLGTLFFRVHFVIAALAHVVLVHLSRFILVHDTVLLGALNELRFDPVLVPHTEIGVVEAPLVEASYSDTRHSPATAVLDIHCADVLRFQVLARVYQLSQDLVLQMCRLYGAVGQPAESTLFVAALPIPVSDGIVPVAELGVQATRPVHAYIVSLLASDAEMSVITLVLWAIAAVELSFKRVHELPISYALVFIVAQPVVIDVARRSIVGKIICV